MPIYSFDIPAGLAVRVGDKMATRHSWDGVNPPTKAEFVMELMIAWLIREVKAEELKEAKIQLTDDHVGEVKAAEAASDADNSLDAIVPV